MNIPNNFNVQTKEFVQVVTKFCLYLSKFGAKALGEHLDSIPLRMIKAEGKHLGAFVINKICEQYENTSEPVTRHDLFSSNERRQDIAEARMLLCVFAHKYIKLDHSEISAMFNKTRHFAKRALVDFEKLDESIPTHRKLLTKYRKIDALIRLYIDFKPKS